MEISIYINQINLVEDISQNCALEVEINSHGNLTYDDLEKIIKTNLSFYPQFKLIRILLDQSEQDYINNMMALGTLASPAKVMHLGSHDLVASFLENKKFEEIHDAYMNSEIVRIDIECSHEITRQDVVAILGNDFPSECYGWYIDIYRQRNLFSLYINLKDIGNIKNLKGKERFNKFYELVSGSSLSSKLLLFKEKSNPGFCNTIFYGAERFL
ncbi:MAG: hypothetical protein HWD59_15290 [Coxiellaceae bacterium]|nr:MAG: hypothetical protein HWD59_15290 [Coxiellaceae bacterium]